jgi:hypothetical protein
MLRTMDCREGKSDNGQREDERIIARADALEIALDALLWRMDDALWAAVTRILAEMEAAIAADEPQMLASATVELVLIAPARRIVMIGAEPVTPPPPAVRDRLNHLVYSLGGTPPDSREAPAEEGRRRGAALGP